MLILVKCNCFWYVCVGVKTVKSRINSGTQRILTDEVNEELTQAAAATSQAYAIGTRNMSLTSLSTSASGIYLKHFNKVP